MAPILPQDPMVPGALAVTRLALWEGHRDSLFALACEPDDPWVFTSGGDGLVIAWHADVPDAPGRALARVTGSCYALATDPGAGLLVAGQNGEGLRVFTIGRAVLEGDNQREIAHPTLTLAGSRPLPGATIFDIKALGGGVFLAALGDGRLVRIKVDQAEDSVSIDSRIIPLTDKPLRVMALPVDRRSRIQEATGPLTVAVGASDGMIRWLDGETLEVIAAIKAHEPSVFALAGLPSGGWLSGGRDARLRLWGPVSPDMTLEAPAMVQEIPAHLATINGLALAPGGRMIATAGRDRTIKIWDTQTLALIKVIDRTRFGGHAGSVNRLGWAGAGGRLLVTCSDDRTARLWSLTESPPL